MATKSALLLDFTAALLCYSTTQPWYYCIDLAEDNPHSLSAALGMKHEHLLRILIHCSLAKKHGKRILITKDVKKWQEILGIGDVLLNYSGSQCINDGKKKIYKLFIRLGMSSVPDDVFPKDQRYKIITRIGRRDHEGVMPIMLKEKKKRQKNEVRLAVKSEVIGNLS